MNNGSTEEIEALRREMGNRLLVLGHHYQRPSVLRHADAVGDSLDLARTAVARTGAERIVLCGVRFMAESADLLTGPLQTVYLPDTSAGCPLADMADAAQAEAAWRRIGGAGGGWLPVVYVNSSAELKAWCGRAGGSACTSSNAGRVFGWVRSQGRRVFFLPDEHLGVNTASDLGVEPSRVLAYDPAREGGGLAPEDLPQAEVLVWTGYCHVHTAFTVEQVEAARRRWPDARIIVHPEARHEVVRRCDAHGSTSEIIRYVEAAPAGSVIVIGTEMNLVLRLEERHRGRLTVKTLTASACPNMAVTREEALLDVLRRWPASNVIGVPEPVAADARLALQRMLSL